MQPPPVQYAMTSDGVRIAYTISGSGPPLLMLTDAAVSHTQLEWTHPLFGRIWARFAERNTLIRLDPRGIGLSQRHESLDRAAGTLDIEAVVARAGFERFSLGAVQSSTIPAVRYAASRVGGIERLVFIDGFPRIKDMADTPTVRALSAAAQADFWLATEAIGAAALGAGRDEVRDYGAYIRACIDANYFTAPLDEELALGDVTALLPRLNVPALVVRHTGLQYVTAEMTRELAARLPDARYHEVEGGWADDIEGVADLVNAFLHGAAAELAPSPESADSGVRAILFTDIEDHTPMMQRLGDTAGRALLREHERVTRDAIARHGGSEIKTVGDAFMVSFGSVAGAAQCAVDLQRAFAASPAVAELKVRIGLNAGEPIAEDGDLFGSSVILASRIAAQAKGGEIVVSDVVRSLLAGKNFLFHDRGEVVLRGFEDPVRLYELHWQPDP